jgi:hypothetical protein
MLVEALRIRKLALGPDHPDVGSTNARLGDVYKRQRKYTKAEAMYQVRINQSYVCVCVRV